MNKSTIITGNINTIVEYLLCTRHSARYWVCSGEKEKKPALALSLLGKINVNELEKDITCQHDKCYKVNLKNTESLTPLIQNSTF